VSEEKFSKCEEKRGGKKKYKCGISGVRKKMKGRFRKKNQSVFFGKIKFKIFVAVKS